ncbi:C-terminal processing protease CtpA/Prc, contains a PDZ domain [Sphingomonas guangdongensis]|uniref:Tricorn protease homolog n=1 Tax=Sphingomonas guangdongensis TaxID=1141890 RepID=A0A285QZK6_9SPHN|nr:S41 family peptidase [Sphingomonas guangdongensis]SOB86928.1 C-terminal processing protease CtpA/Prc, contains a PDZ domain [Sphingomonas guangdongensis]
MIRRLAAALLVAASPLPLMAQDGPVARASFAEPTIAPDGQTIAFVSGGDIWEVARGGGIARLLVSDAATEGRPLYSPDGTQLAFTSTRGGSPNIYLLDLASGAVTRLTWAEATEELDSWSPDGRALYFASAAQEVGRQPDIFRIPATGGTPVQVSRERFLSEFHAAPSPDGRSLALVARGISSNQWWRNGSSHIDQSEIWMKSADTYRKLVGRPARHAWPMWSPDGATLTFMSDAGGTENLWRVAASGGEPTQLTRFTDGRVLFPSSNGRLIAFERDQAIWTFDPATGQAAPVAITLRGAPATPPRQHLRLPAFQKLALSPDGQKVAVIGRGEVFAASAKDGGVAQRITDTAVAEREVAWSPDSRRLLYIAERGPSMRVLVEQDVASERATVLTSAGVAAVPVYAPDGKSAAYVVDDRELHVVTLPAAGQPRTDRLLFTGAVATDERYGPKPVWSPDGKWIAFPVTDRRSFTNVHVVPAAGGTARPVSFLGNGQMGQIAWAPDGTYILFDTAQRSEQTKIVRVDLLPHVPRFKEDVFRDLFKPDRQPGTPAAPTDAPAAPAPAAPLPAAQRKGAASTNAKPAPKPVTIVWEGLRERATILPLGLSADTPVISGDGKTLVFRAEERGQSNLYSYNLDELAKEPPVPVQISQSDKPKGDFALSGDGKTLVYLDGGRIFSTALEGPKPKGIDVDASMDVDFAMEKQVMFDQAWGVLDRRFYDPKFHGKDWAALRTRYQPYLAGARTPDEARRVISLMIGELNASHTGIGRPQSGPGSLPNDRVGDLGVRFDASAVESGRGLVVREVIALGPAAIAGIRPGERIAAINGRAIRATDNLDALLENRVGDRVVIGVVGTGGQRSVTVRPVSASTAAGLAYRDWVADRRALVSKLSGGRLGYVHIADMSSDSLDQLYLDLDAENQSKQGVVVDIRNNNGGFVNGYALDVFTRRNYLLMTPRDLFPVPSRQALGQRALGVPTVLLTNESSLSDAEDFTEGYRTLGLGKVVGQPTSGWIIFTGAEPLIDGSSVRVPSTRIEDTRGQNMEGNPRPVDVTVERPLGETLTGNDAQLEAAVKVLLGA